MKPRELQVRGLQTLKWTPHKCREGGGIEVDFHMTFLMFRMSVGALITALKGSDFQKVPGNIKEVSRKYLMQQRI